MDKTSIWIYSIALLVGLFGQIIYAIVFWNNDAMFMGHWIVGLAGMGIAFLGIFWNMYKILK